MTVVMAVIVPAGGVIVTLCHHPILHALVRKSEGGNAPAEMLTKRNR